MIARVRRPHRWAIPLASALAAAGAAVTGCGSGEDAVTTATVPAAGGGVTVVYRVAPLEGKRSVARADADRAVVILRARLHKLGVFQPRVTRSASGDRIIAVLPEATRDEDARAFAERLGATGRVRIYDWEATVVGRDGRPDPTDGAVTGDQLAGQPGNGAGGTRAVADALARRADHADRADHTDHVVLRSEADDRKPSGAAAADRWWFVLRDAPALRGADLTGAKAITDPMTDAPIVAVGFTTAGARRFRALTRTIVRRAAPTAQKTGHFAIAVDDHLVSVLYIDAARNPNGIDPARGMDIKGGFTRDSARAFAALLRHGALPVRLAVASIRPR
jgi:preprotein translocase subunit SecD